jgi:hypothetical protein
MLRYTVEEIPTFENGAEKFWHLREYCSEYRKYLDYLYCYFVYAVKGGISFLYDVYFERLIAFKYDNKLVRFVPICLCAECEARYNISVFKEDVAIACSRLPEDVKSTWCSIYEDIIDLCSFFRVYGGRYLGGLDLSLVYKTDKIDTLRKKLDSVKKRVVIYRALGFKDCLDANLSMMRTGRLLCGGELLLERDHSRLRFSLSHGSYPCPKRCSSVLLDIIDIASYRLLEMEEIAKFNSYFAEEGRRA